MYFSAKEISKYRYCLLEYRTSEDVLPDSISNIVMVVFEDCSRHLRFLIHKELSQIVPQNDLEYIESLFSDFKERVKIDPDALFKQLTSLSVGPLVNIGNQQLSPAFPNMPELSSKFIEFK
jgi:hypothetical protein